MSFVLLAATFFMMQGTFNMTHFNLEVGTLALYFDDYGPNHELRHNHTAAADEMRVIKYRNIFDYYREVEFNVYFEEYPERDCSLLSLTFIKYDPVNSHTDIIIATLPFQEVPENKYKCIVDVSKLYQTQGFIDFYNKYSELNAIYRDSNEIELKNYIVALIKGLPKKTFGVIAKYDLTISEKGFSTVLEQSARVKRQSKLNDYIKYTEYTGYNTVWDLGSWWNAEPEQIKYFSHEQEIQYLTDTVVEDLVRHRLILEPVGASYLRYPDTVTKGLSKVGGLMALLQVGIILKMFHAKRFVRSVEKNLLQKEEEQSTASKSGKPTSINEGDDEQLITEESPKESDGIYRPQTYVELFSIENFVRMNDTIAKLEGEVKRLSKLLEDKQTIANLKQFD
ncbi:hypothetical protein FGO68_gene3738 [Halteria grandinella]|uniref:Uncharacterized protein n=1 Tax=Halteria grandinella TaxID=5974 RepID=A0A8J8NQG0_HALGN|nr:hypothetical protein FGO68_gene3738 [Halteria grandinella]